MIDKLQKLFSNRLRYPKEEQVIIEGWMKTADELAQVEDVKNMPAWQTLQGKIREDLKSLLLDKVKDDPRAYALSQVLSAMNMKTTKENLEAAIESVITDF